MDLRFGDSEPTDDERAAVDALLGPPTSFWEGAARSEADLRRARPSRDRRHLLLPGLLAINDRVGWISEGALAYLCRRLTVPPAEAYGVATFSPCSRSGPAPPPCSACARTSCARPPGRPTCAPASRRGSAAVSTSSAAPASACANALRPRS